ncbi:type I 3-dehydroquinase-domain-containing protein [Morchella snyderi]|nr:type I 3-dehydroquinase-domain-containing protein [Morchella snyderi]
MKRKLAEVAGLVDAQPQRPRSPLPRHAHIPPLPSVSRPRCFPANASIALIGLRGVGKSTIGVIVSSTLRRRLIDADMHFVQLTGMAAGQYATAHGWPAYRSKEADILADILRDHDTGAVIVCSSGCVERPGSRALLRDWMERHPVVHIVRHEKEVEAYISPQSPGQQQLQVPGAAGPPPASAPQQTLRRLAARREPMYTVCSNFEFYNLWDKKLVSMSGASPPSSPTLKRVEQDFLRLLNFAFQQEMAPLIVWDRNSPHPASAAASTALEDRLYTYALVLPPNASFGPIDGGRIADLDDLSATVEAFDLRIDHLLHSAMPVGANKRDSTAVLRFVSKQFAHVRRQSNLPIIYHVGTVDQDGSYPARPTDARSEDDYFNLLYHGLRLGAEYLVVELQYSDQRIRELVASKGATKIIGSYHEKSTPAWDGPERIRMYDRAAQLGCDIARLSQRATCQGDNFAAIAFSWEVKRRRDAAAAQPGGLPLPSLIAFNTGKLGRMSLFMNRVLSPVTHPRLVEHQKQQQQQQLDVCELEDAVTPREALIAIHACAVLPRRQFCIFGSAIMHSLSPAMHNAAYALYGLPHNYRVQQAASINELLHIVQDPNFGGASITLPFKLEIIPLLHSISDHARAIGAVNTIVPIDSDRRGGGDGEGGGKGDGGAHLSLHGDNTDWIGIRTCTLRYLTPVNAITARTSALVVGAGGMARAAIYALQKLGVENIFIYGRSVHRAADLAQYFNCRSRSSSLAVPPPPATGSPTASDTHIPSGASSPTTPTGARSTVRVLPSLDNRWPEDFWLPSIVVSCIPAHSIQGAPPANFTLPEEWLASPMGGVCVELAYKPRVTPLLHQVRALAHRGWIGVDGLEVLPEQGYAQFEMFLGRQAPRRVMREAVEAAYEEVRRASAATGAAGPASEGELGEMWVVK